MSDIRVHPTQVLNWPFRVVEILNNRRVEEQKFSDVDRAHLISLICSGQWYVCERCDNYIENPAEFFYCLNRVSD